MKALYLLLTFVFTLIISVSANAENGINKAQPCEIGEILIEVEPCDESGNFEVVLTFEYSNIGTEGFRVQGNGNNYGNFEYQSLPITIGPLEGDGITEYEFVVIDNEIEDCSNWTAIDPVDCTSGECVIFDLVVDDHPCDGEHFNVYLNFEYENVSGEGFSLYVNDDLFESYSYEDLPLESIGPFLGDGVTVYVFEVFDQIHDNCFDIKEFGPIDCGTGGECNIWNVEADVLPCDEAGFFNIALNFEFENVGVEGFRVQGNGNNYGTFEFGDIPITIGPLEGDGVTEYEFVVIDNQFEDCSDWTAIDPVDCGGNECNIWDVVATVLPCDENGFFMVLINFEYENVSEAGFSLLGNGNNYGDFLYEYLPVEIGPLEGDGSTIYEFLARDKQFEDCSDWTEIDPVNCETAPQMTNLETEVTACLDNLYQLTINFDYDNEGEEGFIVTGNNKEYGEFQYNELPVIISQLWTDGVTPYYFIVKDKANISYGNWNQLIPFTCENLGIADDLEEEILVYPNPFVDAVRIRYQIPDPGYRLPAGQAGMIEIYSISGIKIREFMSEELMDGEFEIEIDLNEIPPGVYFIRMQVGNEILVKKLVKVE